MRIKVPKEMYGEDFRSVNDQVIAEYRANDGALETAFAGAPILLLTHRGAASGRPTRRRSPTRGRRHHVVIASMGGAPVDPQWYRNLVAHPDVEIEVGAETIPVHARVATGAERERLFRAQADEISNFDDYQAPHPRAAARPRPRTPLTPSRGFRVRGFVRGPPHETLRCRQTLGWRTQPDTPRVGWRACRSLVLRRSGAASSCQRRRRPPAPWRDAPVVTIDDAVLADPAPTVAACTRRGPAREPVVIDLGVDPAAFREPPSIAVEPWRLAPAAEPWFDRLHFLVWANTTTPGPASPSGGGASRRPASTTAPTATPDGAADITLPDGRRPGSTAGPACRSPAGIAVVHSESVDARRADGRPAAGRAAGRPGPRPAGRRRPRRRPGPGHRPGRLGQDPGAHRAPPPPPPRPRLRAGGRPRRRLQQAGPAGDGGPHHRLPAPGPHAQLARPVGPRRAPRRVAPGGRRARGAAARSSRCCPAAASAAPTPTRSVRTSRG